MNNLIPLKHFGFLSITGKDALKFLQGYTTCDLNDLQKDKSLIGAVCNIQGRMVSNFRIILIEDGYLLRLDLALIPVVQAFLQKYIVFSKAKLEDLSAKYQCYGHIGQVDDGTSKTHLPTPNEVALKDGQFVIGITSQRFEYWLEEKQIDHDDNIEILTSWREAEIEDGQAWVNIDSESEYLPQMFNLDSLGGVSFEKGCYLGQEIVTRMQHRGKLKKILHKGSADRAVTSGENLLSEEGRILGKIVAAVNNKFLAVIQTKALESTQVLLEDKSSTKVFPL